MHGKLSTQLGTVFPRPYAFSWCVSRFQVSCPQVNPNAPLGEHRPLALSNENLTAVTLHQVNVEGNSGNERHAKYYIQEFWVISRRYHASPSQAQQSHTLSVKRVAELDLKYSPVIDPSDFFCRRGRKFGWFASIVISPDERTTSVEEQIRGQSPSYERSNLLHNLRQISMTISTSRHVRVAMGPLHLRKVERRCSPTSPEAQQPAAEVSGNLIRRVRDAEWWTRPVGFLGPGLGPPRIGIRGTPSHSSRR
ncbi:hypothetical protein H4582DRAFT_2055966 [Lactarius indigo]|nr:hypothetical protein H4582DRAFT_2055966 [Lactarius indigo]